MSRWRRGRRAGDPREASFGDSGPARRLPLSRRIEIAAAAVGILAGGFLLGPKIADILGSEEPIRLEIDEPMVSNPGDDFGGAAQSTATDPKVAVTVRNRGTATAWIEEARITVVAGARLGICVAQGGGDVPHTKDYRVTLPEFPGERRWLVRRDLHAEVQPGHGVRPLLSFQKRDPVAAGLYAIAVELVADPGGRVYDAGRFVIGVPGPVSRRGGFLPEEEDVLRSSTTTARSSYSTACFRHNLEAIRRVLAEPGLRSGEIAALEHVRPAPGWSSFYADRRPAPIVVEELLENPTPDASLYAIEAARRSGDPELEATTRERAVEQLLRQGEEDLANFPLSAVERAERVLSLGPSPAAARLLGRAKAAVSVEDEPGTTEG